MPLLSVKIDLETVTLLFLGGANSRGQPELRPPSFRGALRYWLRAVLGGALGNDLDALRCAEAAVFGSTNEEMGGASALVLRVIATKLPEAQSYQRQPFQWVTKSGKKIRQPTGRDYLYWSMAESGSHQRGNYQPPKQYLPSGTPFQLVLSTRPGARQAQQAFDETISALWLLSHLGGIGSRSRRTAGSLSVRNSDPIDGLKFLLEKDTVDGISQELGAGLTKIRQRFQNGHPTSLPGGMPAFDALSPDHCRVWVVGVWPSPESAVEAIGQRMRDFRTYTSPDHENVARWLQGEAIPTVQRSAFGLPLPYRYSNGGPSGVVQGSPHQKIDRRASPLWLRVSKTADGSHYVGIATLFKSAFLPAGEKLHAKTRGHAPPIDPPADYSLIEGWLASDFDDCQEVHYA